MSDPKVLAITKRTAELCCTQSLLYSAGFELVTATNMVGARSVMNAVRVGGVIVCKHSWSEQERESIASEVAKILPDVTVLMRCPGCEGCDEATHTPGTLSDTLPLTQLVTALTPIKE